MLLQDRIEELGSGIIEIDNYKVNLTGFMSAERLEDYYERNIDCHYSKGIYENEKLDYSRIQDNALFITIENGKEISRCQFEPLLVVKGEDQFKYASIDENNKKVEKTGTFSIRRCRYTKKYNYKDKDESRIFDDFTALKEYIWTKYNKDLEKIFFIKYYVESGIFVYKDSYIKEKFFHSKKELLEYFFEKYGRLIKSSEIIRNESIDKNIYHKVLAIDFETANSNLRSICSVGIALSEDKKIIFSKEFLVNPEEEFESRNIDVHDITEEDVKDKPLFLEVWNKIKGVIDKNTLVIAHNASFDMAALKKVCEKYGIELPSFKYLCTYKAAQKVFPGLKNSLDSIAERLNIDLNHHKSGADALVCLKIFNYMTRDLKVLDQEDIEETLKTSIEDIKDNKKRSKRSSENNVKSSSYKKMYKNAKINIKDIHPESDYIDENNGVFGCIFVFTGDLESFSNRREAMQKVVNLGGKLGNSVTKNTDYLVCGKTDLTLTKGNKKSSKEKKAEEYIDKGINIKIIDEDEFKELLDSRYEETALDLDSLEEDSIEADTIEPASGWAHFQSEEDKMDRLKGFKLIPPKAKVIDKVFYYKGAYTETAVKCDILGFMYCDNDILVIKIGDRLHCIRAEYLKQMQDKNFNKFSCEG